MKKNSPKSLQYDELCIALVLSVKSMIVQENKCVGLFPPPQMLLL